MNYSLSFTSSALRSPMAYCIAELYFFIAVRMIRTHAIHIPGPFYCTKSLILSRMTQTPLLRKYAPKEFTTAKLGFLVADHVKRALSPDLIALFLEHIPELYVMDTARQDRNCLGLPCRRETLTTSSTPSNPYFFARIYLGNPGIINSNFPCLKTT